MKNLLTIIFLLLAFYLRAQEPLKTQESSKVLMIQEKNPATSFILSTFIPGTGQMYNGQVKEGLIIFGSEIVLLGCGGYLVGHEEPNIGTVCLILGGGLYLYQLVQAPLYTDKKNKKIGFTLNNSKINLNSDHYVSINSVGLMFKF